MKILDLIYSFYDYCDVFKSAATSRYSKFHLNTVIKFFSLHRVEIVDQFDYSVFTSMIVHFKKTCRNISVNKKILLLKQVFELANIEKDFLVSFKKLKQDKRHYGSFSEEDLKKIMNYIDSLDASNPYQLTRMLILLLLIDTGCRQSELLEIKIEHIDLESQLIKLESTKTKENRYVFFSYMSKSLLAEYVAFYPDRKYLFFNYMSYDRFTYKNLTSFMARLKIDLNLKDCHAHMFRHTMATLLVENGCPLDTVQVILGHKSLSTTQIYLHMSVRKAKRDYENFSFLTKK